MSGIISECDIHSHLLKSRFGLKAMITPDRWLSDFAKLDSRGDQAEGAEGECEAAIGDLGRRNVGRVAGWRRQRIVPGPERRDYTARRFPPFLLRRAGISLFPALPLISPSHRRRRT
jgi:hypothetical protein